MNITKSVKKVCEENDIPYVDFKSSEGPKPNEVLLLTTKGIYDLKMAKKYEEADKAIRLRMKASGLDDKQVSGLMMYAYEHGHAYGQDEVLSYAIELMGAVER